MPLPSRKELETRYGQMVAEQQAREAAAARQIAQGMGDAIGGLGTGVMNQVRSLRDIAESPVTQNYLYDIATMSPRRRGLTELAEMGKAAIDPETYKAILRDYQERGSTARGLGEIVGENINPATFLRGFKPVVRGMGEFDLRYDPRVKEREKLLNVQPQVESRGTVNAPEISITELEGKPFITSMSDRTAAGGYLTGVNDVTFNRPVNLQGGQDFMFENPGMVWASGKSPVNQIRKLAAMVKSTTGENPLYIPWRMAPTGGDFASMTGETMLNYADAALSKRVKRDIDKEIKALIPDWSGIGSDRSIEQFQSAKDKIRKQIKQKLDVNFREQGGLGLGEARIAVSDPRQLTAPDTGIQNVGEIFANEPAIVQSGHPAYPTGVPGRGLGRIKEDVRVYELLDPVVQARGIANPRAPSQQDIRALQMKPYYGRITAETLKRLGY